MITERHERGSVLGYASCFEGHLNFLHNHYDVERGRLKRLVFRIFHHSITLIAWNIAMYWHVYAATGQLYYKLQAMICIINAWLRQYSPYLSHSSTYLLPVFPIWYRNVYERFLSCVAPFLYTPYTTTGLTDSVQHQKLSTRRIDLVFYGADSSQILNARLADDRKYTGGNDAASCYPNETCDKSLSTDWLRWRRLYWWRQGTCCWCCLFVNLSFFAGFVTDCCWYRCLADRPSGAGRTTGRVQLSTRRSIVWVSRSNSSRTWLGVNFGFYSRPIWVKFGLRVADDDPRANFVRVNVPLNWLLSFQSFHDSSARLETCTARLSELSINPFFLTRPDSLILRKTDPTRSNPTQYVATGEFKAFATGCVLKKKLKFTNYCILSDKLM